MTQPDQPADTMNVYQDAAGEWRWHRVAANNKIIATSGEGYEHKDDCLIMAASLAAPRNGVPCVMSIMSTD